MRDLANRPGAAPLVELSGADLDNVAGGLNPQPLPPGMVAVALNPQPLPPFLNVLAVAGPPDPIPW
jgi:hypothetical protein